MIIPGKITDYNPETGEMKLEAVLKDFHVFMRRQFRTAEIRLDDGRTISNQQRRKARALIGDIANWAGYSVRDESDNLHEIMKAQYCVATGDEWFSLATCDMTTARHYITYLVDFCLEHGVPCIDQLLKYAEDIDAYLYGCMWHRRCCICGADADLHHVDRIGMGNDRRRVEHVGRRAMALCRKHHTECHQIGQPAFDDRYHVYGIQIDRMLADHLRL